jgi:molybdenum cofactor sulfurtransferase
MLDESSWFSDSYSVVWIFVPVLLLMLWVQPHKRLSSQEVIVSSSQEIGAFERKKDFVTRAGGDYGYRDDNDSGGGGRHIDHWRSTEFPGLIPPLGTASHDEAEVYLDYAGSALPSVTQLSHILKDGTQILANPHSAGPAASRTTRLVNQATKLVLDHFNCHADPDYGPYLLKDSKSIPHGLASNLQKKEPHPGYEVIFTSGSTESLRLVAELFPWYGDNQEPSILLYPQQVHTSVVGMRACAQSCGAVFQCEPLDTICNASVDTFSRWTKQQAALFDEETITGTPTSSRCDANQSNSEETVVNHLLALPLECNFSGDRPDVSSAMAAARSASSPNHQWHFLLDIAKAASTGPVNLKALDPDFACISFYKLFGFPTGLGALFVKRNKVDLLKSSRNKPRYFGGGSVDVVLPGKDLMVARSEPSLLASLKNGTIHFRGIASLIHGFRELDRVGGMEKVSCTAGGSYFVPSRLAYYL